AGSSGGRTWSGCAARPSRRYCRRSRRGSEERMPQVIAATFADEAAATRGLATIVGALLGGGLKQGAVVHKEADGKIKFVETKDLSASQGAKFGGLAGAVLGIIAGPIGVIGGGAVGAGIG